jgi:type IV pilus assembly protein PilQ
MKIYGPVVRLGTLILAGAGLLPGLAGAQQAVQVPAATSAALKSVSQVEVTRAARQTIVRVNTEGDSGELAYHVSRLSNPPRVVLDLDSTRLSAGPSVVSSSYEPVRSVRLGQFRPSQARIVIDLARSTGFFVDQQGQDLTVTFLENETAGKAPSKLPVARVEQPAKDHKAEFSLPASLTGQEQVFASPSQAAAVSVTPTVFGSLPVPAVPPAQAAPAPAPQAPGQPAAAAPAQQRYTGEPISVDLRDVDLRDFFRLVHEISGLNVVLDPAVRGTVTLVLDEVPWDQALDIVLRNNQLNQELDGNVLRIATHATLQREAEQRRDLERAEAEAVPTVTTTRVLSYAKASELSTTLRRFLSPRGEIFPDDRSNSMIIRDIPDVLPQVDNLIRQLDRKSQQVEIEARVVLASRSFARDIGTQLAFATTSTSGRSVYGGNLDLGESPIVTRPLPPPLVGPLGGMPLATNFPAVGPTSGFTFAHASPNFALDYLITAAESRGVGKLLSSPQLVTQNNAQATVMQGTKIPVQTSINNTIAVQFINAVLQLQVTPQITADGTVYMEVLVENTSIDPGIDRIQGIPALATQSAETRVLIGDGGTVVIGGVIISQQRTDVQQVPLVGSVPIIGHLFKRTAVSVSSQELLFFLTPRILPG